MIDPRNESHQLESETREARRALADAIDSWLFDMCFTCGEPRCADWCVDLDTQAWETELWM